MESEPALEEWKKLYDAAEEFKKLECWNIVEESDVFGVQNPETGEIGYCCIMGRAGEHFALGLYLGSEGLETLLKISSSNMQREDMFYAQKCLMASFENRQVLRKPDLQIIKDLGLVFRGSASWPLFRNYLPGYFPWYLNKEEVAFLTLTLQQACEVCRRFSLDPRILGSNKGKYLVRVFDKENKSWFDSWLEPEPFMEKEIPAQVSQNERKLLEKLNGIANRDGSWEIDFFYLPSPVREKGERPYYPYMMFVSHHASYMILGSHMIQSKKLASEFPSYLLGLIESCGLIPEELLVRSEDVSRIMEPVVSSLGIKIRRVKSLSAINDARRSMFDYFMRRR